jgi:hypothetical protein
MARRILVLAVIGAVVLFVGIAYAGNLEKMKPMPPELKVITGGESVPEAYYHPSDPRLTTQSPGDTVGYTQYDYQTNGSTGNRVVVGSDGNLHFAWMKGYPYPTHRWIYYNCLSTEWQWPGSGTQVSYRDGDGYCQISATLDSRAVIAYHNAWTTGAESLYLATDSYPCLGFFYYQHPPGRLGTNYLTWPYITVDRTGRIHLIAMQSVGSVQPFGYSRSINGGTTWTALTRVDTLKDISPIITSSPVSGKVAIVYTHPADTSTQWKNDIYYIQSADGTTWDFRTGKVNVTQYGQGGDSLWAYTDCDAVYDYNDNLHIVWNAQYVTTGIYYKTFLLHYDVASGNVSEITHSDSLWPSAGCDFSNWNWFMAKESIGRDSLNHLFVTYTSWDTSDCSACGYANGDIYMNLSVDGGATWSQTVNMTNSHTPGCVSGDCDSDHWSSLAEEVNANLHVFFVNDKDAGGIPQSECAATDNPMLYLAYQNPVYHDFVNEGDALPGAFTLAQNYPNPFNAKTSIGYTLNRESDVKLAVYDLTGALVTTLVNGYMQAGTHQVSWNAGRVPSGVYYYKLTTKSGTLVKKMTLLK